MYNQKYNSILEQFFHTENIKDYSLQNIRQACEHFGNPQNSFKSIHIAGTNGKGSVSKMIFQMLKESGKRVWVYTSPHNIDIRERFEVGNCFSTGQDFSTSLSLRSKWQAPWSWLISEDDFARIAERIIEYGHELSYFELCTILAFLYFHEQQCEYVVIEVGIGGRLDATNIITPILSIITSISYDHMEFLGDTLEMIATEKWGIIKSWVPVILYWENLVLQDIARHRDARVIFPKKRSIKTNLLGDHQIANGCIAYEAGVFLGIPEDVIKNALLYVDHHGRMEYIFPNLLIDGAHNEDGIRKLRHYLDSIPWEPSEILYAVNLKKWKQIALVTGIFPDVSEWIIVESSHQMVENPLILAQELSDMGKDYRLLSPVQIVQFARENPEKLFVVFGSLYMIGEFQVTPQ